MLVRPSYVLGGRGMEIVYDDDALEAYIERATEISPEHPVLVDRFLDDAVEIDVDALFDGEELFLGGVMEHIEEAGIHSGDSSCALPPITLGAAEIDRIREATEAIARGVGVRGLLNIQFALGSDVLYVLEANPRASRTVPFVSKATATPLAKAAARVMLGESIADAARRRGAAGRGRRRHLPADAPIAVKEAVMPFNRFRTPDGRNVDTVLGPEMKSTGEVMGFDADFGTAFAKAQAGAFGPLPTSGRVFVEHGQPRQAAHDLPDQGARRPRLRDPRHPGHRRGAAPQRRRRRPSCASTSRARARTASRPPSQLILDGEIDLVINTPNGSTSGGSRAARRLRDPHRRDHGQHPVHHHRAGTRRRGAGHRGDASAARSASARCRTGPDSARDGCYRTSRSTAC